MANNRELSQFANVVGYNGGNIGIGTDNPLQKLHLSDTTSANIYLQTHNSGTGSTAGVYFRTSDSSTADGFFKTAIVLEDDGTTFARGKLHILQENTADASNATLDDSVLTIDQSGRLLVGHDSNTTPYVAGKVQVSATDSSAALSIARYQNTASNPYLALVKSRGGLGNATIVQDNDGLGYITFVGADGNDLTSEGAAIAAEVDGTPGQDDMPGALIFKTTSDGSNSASERLRITSDGKMGVGTASPTSLIHGQVSSGSAITTLESTATSGEASVSLKGKNSSGTVRTGIFKYDNADMFRIGTTASIPIRFETNDTERLRIDSSGRLLVGKQIHSGDALFVVETEHASGGIIGEFDNNNSGNFGGVRILGGVIDRECRFQSLYGSSFFTFYTEGTGAAIERMRITSDGNMRFGQSTTDSPGYGNTTVGISMLPDGRIFSTTGGTFSQFNRNSDGAVLSFARSSTGVGQISVTTSSTTYGTSSDYRLKENVVALDGAITRVKQLLPKRFNFIVDADTTVDGFFAHEAQTVVPEAVTGTHNEVDDDGNAVMQSIDQSKLVPLLTAALQEAIAKIETLETQNTDLLARVTALEGS